jgi:hypothetical protein
VSRAREAILVIVKRTFGHCPCRPLSGNGRFISVLPVPWSPDLLLLLLLNGICELRFLFIEALLIEVLSLLSIVAFVAGEVEGLFESSRRDGTGRYSGY